VLNVNVLASALISPAGPPAGIVRALIERGAFVLVCSDAILNELERCLFYPRVRKHIRASDREVRQWVAALAVVAETVVPATPLAAVAADPDDDKYLAAASEGRAEYVVSGDSHLLAVGHHAGIEIVTPRQFLAILESTPAAHQG
jgi:putative PIN family toxin of toxin-antitoxin system